MQAGCTDQLTMCGSDRKTGSNHIQITPFLMPGLDQLPAIGFSGLFRICQSLWSITVHQHLTGHHQHVIIGSHGKKRIDRFLMNRGISHTRCRSVTEKLIHKETGYPLCIFRVTEGFFHRIRIFVQPVKQLSAIHTDHLRLRIMNMRINQPRHQ